MFAWRSLYVYAYVHTYREMHARTGVGFSGKTLTRMRVVEEGSQWLADGHWKRSRHSSLLV